jgi:hypothetical protein
MATIRDYTLAQIASTAFLDNPTGLPGGLAPVTASDLGVVIDNPAESFANGIYRFGNAAALVGTGILGGQDTLVLAFRGADDRQDSINVLNNPATDYAKFAELIAAVDKLAASGAYQQVAITGHSLGGSLTQIFMAEHPGGSTPVRYFADTFGSPGALVADSADARITNFVVVDDPAVFLGENREGVGNALDGNVVLERAAAELAARVFPGLTTNDALDAIPNFTTNYENAGNTVNLPGKAGGTGPFTSVTGLLQADPAEHEISLYIRKIGDIAFRLPGRGAEQLFDAGFYLQRNGDVAAVGIDAQQHFDTYGWREGRDPNAFFSTRDYLAGNQDVAAAGINPLIHYLLFGWSEGRDPGPDFHTSSYLQANPDVAAAGINPLQHYLVYGINEGRIIA